jgi:hypothetical protein
LPISYTKKIIGKCIIFNIRSLDLIYKISLTYIQLRILGNVRLFFGGGEGVEDLKGRKKNLKNKNGRWGSKRSSALKGRYNSL